MQEDTDRIFTVEDVAEYMNLSAATVYKLAQQGKLSGRKVAGRWRFSRRALVYWLAGDQKTKQPQRTEE